MTQYKSIDCKAICELSFPFGEQNEYISRASEFNTVKSVTNSHTDDFRYKVKVTSLLFPLFSIDLPVNSIVSCRQMGQ